MSWLTRLFTISKHVDPAVAAVAQPTLDAAHATVTTATQAINPAVDEAVAAADALADQLLGKLGVAGTLLTPAAHVGVQMAFSAVIAALNAKLGVAPGDTVAPAHATN